MAIDPDAQRTYPVTPSQMASFRTILAENDIAAPSGNSGQIEADGVTVSFTYDGTATLTLVLVSKPFYIPAAMVWSEIEGYLPK
jgi:hypothetical protein